MKKKYNGGTCKENSIVKEMSGMGAEQNLIEEKPFTTRENTTSSNIDIGKDTSIEYSKTLEENSFEGEMSKLRLIKI